MQTANKYKNLLSNTLILGLGVFASKFLVFLMMPLYTGILSPGEYNLADLISQTANLIMPLACIGITDGVFRFTLDGEKNRKSVLSSGLFVLLVISVLFIALSPLISFVEYFSSYGLTIAMYVFAANLHSLLAQYVRACNRTKLFALQGIINTALVIGLNILFLVVFKLGVIGYVGSVIIADLIVSIFLLFAGGVARDISVKEIKKETIKSLAKYSIPMIPATIFWWITSVSDRYMVTFMKSEFESGLYTAAYKIPTMLTLVSNVFIEAWQYSAVSEKEGRERFFGRVFEYYQSIIFLASGAMIAMSQVFIIVLCADSYFEAWRFIPVLMISAVFSGFTAFFGSVYLVKKKSVLTLVTSMTGALVNIVFNLILIPSLGAQGAAIATCISYAAVFAIRAINTRKYVRFSLHGVRMTLNIIILCIEAACVLMIGKYVFWIGAGFTVLLLLANAKPFIEAIRYFLGAILKKTKNKEKI